jgi:hypothetical protein
MQGFQAGESGAKLFERQIEPVYLARENNPVGVIL